MIETLNKKDLLILENQPKELLDDIVTGDYLALIPPYDLASEQNTATMAQSIKTWYPERNIGIVMPMVYPSRLCQLVRTFEVSGFKPIVFLRHHNIKNLIPRLKRHLSPAGWYHVTDPNFEIPFAGVEGKWTKGEEI